MNQFRLISFSWFSPKLPILLNFEICNPWILPYCYHFLLMSTFPLGFLIVSAFRQTSINDFHIELLDNGGQYHVAQWLINEVEESGSTQLVMNINLDLALQGCDPHVVQFLHNLPYGQVLGIKTSVKSGQSVVDFSDGSSWESEFCDRALHGEDGDLFFIWESSKVKPKADHRMVNWKLEQLQAPAIDVDVLEDRPLPETSNFLTESSSIPTDKAPYSLLPIVKPKLLPPVLWRPFPDFLGSKEMAICIASFSYVLMVMVKSCELATLVVDACMIGFVGSFVVAAACFVGAVSPPLPKILREKWPQTETKARTWKSLSISNKPWEQVREISKSGPFSYIPLLLSLYSVT